MTGSVFVIFTKSGVDRAVKTDNFTLKSGEYAVRVDLEVSDEVFKKRPIPSVKIDVDPSMVAKHISAELDAVDDLPGPG